MDRTQIVIPCYNEAERLDVERFQRFSKSHPRFRFLFVNDGSTDATASLIDGLQAASPHSMAAFHLGQNQGKAEAVRQGLLLSLATDATAVGYWDADLSTPLDALTQFQDVLERRPDIQLVMGTRLPLMGRSIERRWIRQKLGRIFGRCASYVVGLPIYDTQCGAKLLRAGNATRSLFAERFTSRWIFDVEMLVRWRVACRIMGSADPHAHLYELPLERWLEVKGSRLKSTDFIRAIGELWSIRRKYASQLYGDLPIGNAESDDSALEQAA